MYVTDKLILIIIGIKLLQSLFIGPSNTGSDEELPRFLFLYVLQMFCQISDRCFFFTPKYLDLKEANRSLKRKKDDTYNSLEKES